MADVVIRVLKMSRSTGFLELSPHMEEIPVSEITPMYSYVPRTDELRYAQCVFLAHVVTGYLSDGSYSIGCLRRMGVTPFIEVGHAALYHVSFFQSLSPPRLYRVANLS